jgi:hypothetical protein
VAAAARGKMAAMADDTSRPGPAPAAPGRHTRYLRPATWPWAVVALLAPLFAATPHTAAAPAAGSSPSQAQPAPPAGRPYNVLFIAVDDLRPELGCYGNAVVKSPNIDKLAAGGVVFEHAYCQQAVCSPSRSSLMTGRRPDATRVWDLVTHFRTALPDAVTLPQHFKANGYHTAALNKIYHHGFEDGRSWSEPH